MKTISKKGTSQIGVAIIIMGLLLLIGGIFFDNQNKLFKEKQKIIVEKNSFKYNSSEIPENYLFYLKDTDIGRQKKVTQSYPNLILGSKEEHNIVYIGNRFRLNSNFLTANKQTISVPISNNKSVKNILLYFKPNWITGKNNLIIRIGNKVYFNNDIKNSDIPIKISNFPKNNDSLPITFELKKPKWFNVISFSKLDIEDLKVIEVKRNIENNKKTLNFIVEKENLENVFINLVISCDEDKKEGDSIQVEVNGFILSNFNPICSKRNKLFTTQVPLNIINNKNQITLKTNGYYKIAIGIDKIYYNDIRLYKFNINNFNDLIDVVIYGKFDKEALDLRINSKLISLKRGEILSIIPYLRFGVNEIEILNKPIEITELVVEKSEFYN